MMNEPPARLDTTVQISPTAHSCGERGIHAWKEEKLADYWASYPIKMAANPKEHLSF